MNETLQQWMDESTRLVFFGGAGVSTESGIPDFRSVDGLYHQAYDVPPEVILSHSFYERDPETFFRFYREKLLCLTAQPNAAHRQLARLEQVGKLRAVITQNIDGLHQAAGSRMVLELHGSVHRNYCEQCHRLYDAAFMKASSGVPTCACGGRIKPDVVLYGEPLDSGVMEQAIRFLREADLLLVAGTSLSVYPAAGLLRYFGGAHLVLINRDATPMDSAADLVIRGRVGEVLGSLRIPPLAPEKG